jgi:hypothetical protein
MAIVIFIVGVLLWWTVATIILGRPSIQGSEGNFRFGFLIAVIAVNYYVPAIVVTALSEFASTFLPLKWRSAAYLLFAAVSLVVLAFVTDAVLFKAGTEGFRVIVYPAVAVALLYAVRSVARRPV